MIKINNNEKKMIEINSEGVKKVLNEIFPDITNEEKTKEFINFFIKEFISEQEKIENLLKDFKTINEKKYGKEIKKELLELIHAFESYSDNKNYLFLDIFKLYGRITGFYRGFFYSNSFHTLLNNKEYFKKEFTDTYRDIMYILNWEKKYFSITKIITGDMKKRLEFVEIEDQKEYINSLIYASLPN